MEFSPRFAIVVAGGFSCVPGVAVTAPAEVLTRLAAESFKEREAAQAALLAWAQRQPAFAKNWLLDRSRLESDPEVRRRCLAVLRELVLEDYFKAGKGYVGILMQAVPVQVPTLPAARFGIRVTMVMPGSPAAQAGLRPGVLIVGVNDQHWGEPGPEAAFSQWIQARSPGDKVTLKVLEDGEVRGWRLELGRRPENADQPMWQDDPADLERRDQESRDLYFKRWLEERSARR